MMNQKMTPVIFFIVLICGSTAFQHLGASFKGKISQKIQARFPRFDQRVSVSSRAKSWLKIQARPYSFDDTYEDERDHSLALAIGSSTGSSIDVGGALKPSTEDSESTRSGFSDFDRKSTLFSSKVSVAKVLGYSLVMTVVMRLILSSKLGGVFRSFLDVVSFGCAILNVGPLRPILLSVTAAANAALWMSQSSVNVSSNLVFRSVTMAALSLRPEIIMVGQKISYSAARIGRQMSQRWSGRKSRILRQMQKEHRNFLSAQSRREARAKAKAKAKAEVYEHVSYLIRAQGMGSEACLHKVNAVLEKIPGSALVHSKIDMSRGLLSLTLRVQVQTQIDVLEALMLVDPNQQYNAGAEVDSDDVRIIKNLCHELSAIGYPSNAVQRIERGVDG